MLWLKLIEVEVDDDCTVGQKTFNNNGINVYGKEWNGTEIEAFLHTGTQDCVTLVGDHQKK